MHKHFVAILTFNTLILVINSKKCISQYVIGIFLEKIVFYNASVRGDNMLTEQPYRAANRYDLYASFIDTAISPYGELRQVPT